MADMWLHEQHAGYVIAQTTSVETDEATSWVMLAQNGDIVRLPHERIRHNAGSRIRLDISVPEAIRARSSPFSAKSDNGTAYITTQRLIYIPAKPTEEFKSFTCPILNIENSHISSPLFGSWYWLAEVRPVSQGGVPPDIPRIELKLTFKDGGHIEFRDKFEEIKERLHQIREVERATGHSANIPDEPLPAYEAQQGDNAGSATGGGDGGSGGGGGSGTSGSLAAPGGSGVGRSASASSQNPRAPDEPPPGYDEAQAQTLSMRLEDHIREAADRQ